MSEFYNAIYEIVRRVPRGKVVSYGQVAAAAGSPRSARAVGWALRLLKENTTVPWWRVINSQGHISIKGNFLYPAERQKALLEKERVDVNADFTLDMKRYRHTFPIKDK